MKVHLGDYDIKSKADGEHVERLVMKVVRHAGFDPQTLVSIAYGILKTIHVYPAE